MTLWFNFYMLLLNPDTLSLLVDWFINPDVDAPPGVVGTRAEVARQCWGQLFLPAPIFAPDAEQVAAFESICAGQLGQSPAREIAYDCPFPKSDFLRYLVHRKGYLLHGTGRQLDALDPSPQADWRGTSINAVFATGDGIWPMFFALLNRAALRGSIRNACLLVESAPGDIERYYFFSVDAVSLASGVWTDGFVHIVPRESFTPTSTGPVRFDEWASPVRVPVAARLRVAPADFPFLSCVTPHPEAESIFETWLRYKHRLGKRS